MIDTKNPFPATILVSSNGQRDRIDNSASIEFLLSKEHKVRVGINPETGNLLVQEFHSDGRRNRTSIIQPLWA